MLPDQKCRANAMPCHAQPSVCAFACFLSKSSRITSLRYGPCTRPRPIKTPVPKLLVCASDFFSLDTGSVAHALEDSALVVQI